MSPVSPVFYTVVTVSIVVSIDLFAFVLCPFRTVDFEFVLCPFCTVEYNSAVEKKALYHIVIDSTVLKRTK